MNTPDACCSPCATTPPVQVPGVAGSQGEAGTNGVNGIDAFSILASDFITPPDLVTPVTITVSSTIWMVIGMNLIIGQGAGVAIPNPGPGTFEITAIPSPSTVTLLYLNETGDVGFSSAISADNGISSGPAGISLPLALPAVERVLQRRLGHRRQGLVKILWYQTVQD